VEADVRAAFFIHNVEGKVRDVLLHFWVIKESADQPFGVVHSVGRVCRCLILRRFANQPAQHGRGV
jgi:hypothetical protein